MSRLTSPLPRPRWLALFVAVLAVAGQLTLAFAPLAEGRDGRMASHVEASGSAGHIAQHSEEKCVSCQARTVVGTTDGVSVAPLILTATAGAEIVDATYGRSATLNHQSRQRAPPFLI